MNLRFATLCCLPLIVNFPKNITSNNPEFRLIQKCERPSFIPNTITISSYCNFGVTGKTWKSIPYSKSDSHAFPARILFLRSNSISRPKSTQVLLYNYIGACY